MFTVPGSLLRALLTGAVALTLAGCATQGEPTGGHAGHRHGTMPEAGPRAMGHSGAAATGSGAGSRGQGMGVENLCAMHRSMRDVPPEQRQEMMDQHMKEMSPEMRARHMEMLRQHCN